MSLNKKPKSSVVKKNKAPLLPKKVKSVAPATPSTTEEKALPKARPSAPAAAPAKRKRNSNPLFAEITLGKLTELLGGDKDAKVTASRNFLLDQSTASIRADAAKALGI